MFDEDGAGHHAACSRLSFSFPFFCSCVLCCAVLFRFVSFRSVFFSFSGFFLFLLFPIPCPKPLFIPVWWGQLVVTRLHRSPGLHSFPQTTSLDTIFTLYDAASSSTLCITQPHRVRGILHSSYCTAPFVGYNTASSSPSCTAQLRKPHCFFIFFYFSVFVLFLFHFFIYRSFTFCIFSVMFILPLLLFCGRYCWMV